MRACIHRLPLTRVRIHPLALPVLLLLILVALTPRWTVDDAYISMRYARSLVETGQLTWNRGEAPVEGYTGIVLVLLYASAHVLPPVLLGQMIGAMSLLACGALLIAIVRELGGGPDRQALALWLFVLTPGISLHAVAGLETMIYCALALYALISALQGYAVRVGLLGALLALTRPEGALLGLLLAATQGWPALLPLVAGGSLYAAWKIGYYGDLLPNTFYAKAGSWLGAGRMLQAAGDVLLLPLLAWWSSRPCWRRMAERKRVLLAALIWTVGCLLVYSRSQLQMDYMHRFFLPLWVVVVLPLLVACWGPQRPCLSRALLYGWALLSALLFSFWSAWAISYQHMEEQIHARAAQELARAGLGAGSLAVVPDAGLVPLHLPAATVYDFGGLNTPDLARESDPTRWLDLFWAWQPDAVVLAEGVIDEGRTTAFRTLLLADPRWAQEYRLIWRGGAVLPPGDPYGQAVYVRVRP